jgi:2-polyprenyl-3-methyl-5-hydroxy-6-metoxy-1,4-benzoquinol methylase
MITDPMPDAEERARHYNAHYYSSEDAARFRSRLAEATIRGFRKARAHALDWRLGGVAGRRVLDVGCGRGEMLAALQRKGADVYGTQISAPAARVAGRLIGRDRVFVGELADARYDAASFDCVTICHVLEHVADPLAVLREVTRLLKPGGLLYVEVPNAGGLAARAFSHAWLAYDVPNHLYHFTPRTLADLARRAGLRRTAESHVSIEYSPVTLLQTVLNATLGADNLLFEHFAYSSRRTDRSAGRARLATHIVVATIIAGPVLVASLIFGAARVGDTYGAYFQHA